MKDKKLTGEYFPHEMFAMSNNKFLLLIQKEGMRGYGIYWGIIEHLRKQRDYQAPLSSLSPLALVMRTTEAVVRRIVFEYDLFTITDNTVSSRGLTRRMRPLDEFRATMSTRGRRGADSKWRLNLESEDASANGKESKGKESITPSTPPQGEEDDFFNSVLEVPAYAFNKKTHNYDGLLTFLQEVRVENPFQIARITRLSNYGEKGNKLWKILNKKGISGWKVLHDPGQSIIRAMQKDED